MKVLLTTICFMVAMGGIALPKKGFVPDFIRVNTTIMDHQTVLTKGKVVLGSQTFVVTYFDNPTARSLIAQMPFTVEVEDYAGIEKIFYPKQSLDKANAPDGADPSTGDIMYYAPWGDVAIFYDDFRFASGLIPIGQMKDVKGFVDALAAANSTVTFKIE